MNDRQQQREARLAVRAARIAYRNIPGRDRAYRDEVCRRIQEVWEDEGADLTPLGTWPRDEPSRTDADGDMRRVWRQRNRLPPEVLCEWCCEDYIERSVAIDGRWCSQKCHHEYTEKHKVKS